MGNVFFLFLSPSYPFVSSLVPSPPFPSYLNMAVWCQCDLFRSFRFSFCFATILATTFCINLQFIPSLPQNGLCARCVRRYFPIAQFIHIRHVLAEWAAVQIHTLHDLKPFRIRSMYQRKILRRLANLKRSIQDATWHKYSPVQSFI